jgi:hypothetical protein
MHIAVRDVSPIFAPLTREYAATRRVLGHGWHRLANERQWLCFVKEGASAGARRKELAEERGADDANQRVRGMYESDGNAAHGKEVYVVDGPIEWVDTPGGAIVDEIVSRCPFGIGFLADESVPLSPAEIGVEGSATCVRDILTGSVA